MNALRSEGVETTAPDAHAPLGLRNVVTSWSCSPDATT
jgi:hypothetical protein